MAKILPTPVPSRVFVRTPYNYSIELASLESGLACPEPTMAQQQFKDECDINLIAERFGLTGLLPQGAVMPTFQDFDGVFDYQTAMNAVLAADAAFMGLPANVRERFGNDPQAFVEFCSDSRNREEAAKLGLVPRPPEPPPSVPSAGPAAAP